jgi:putative flippase GtrA
MTAEREAGKLAGMDSLHPFIKFCIVGFSSTVVDFGILNILIRYAHLDWHIAKCISFVCSVTNGFIWNSRWTFKGKSSARSHEQYLKFTLVNLVGLGLSMGIISLVSNFLSHGARPEHWQVNVGNLVAVGVVVIWNYFGSKKFSFK